jgi:hypothetical protein
MPNIKNPALIIGHPGHELRTFKFINDFKPDVYIITDGSGSNNDSRIDNTIKILEKAGAKYIKLFTPFSDKEIYKLILDGQIDEIVKLKNLIKIQVNEKKYDFILGDALEGFNPTHDLCRYIINGIVYENNLSIQNYAVELDSAPDKAIEINNGNTILLNLNTEELEMKFDAGANYPELKFEVEKALEIYGKTPFATEVFNKVENPVMITNWHTEYPYYETYGREKVLKGTYKTVIEFEKHMKPLAEALLGA